LPFWVVGEPQAELALALTWVLPPGVVRIGVSVLILAL
jgi:hypothetical protein